MTRSISMGRLMGARLEVGWSWLFVLPLVGVALYGSIDPGDGSMAGRVIVAGVGAFVLLVSVLVHELGHAVIARTQGVEVERVAVFLLGGFSEMDLESSGPGVEARVAIAGPIASGVIGAGLVAAAQVTGDLSGADHVLMVLAVVNFGVAAFNLLPAFPLDGGRLVRAALVSSGVDRRKAEIVAAGAGVALGGVVTAVAVFASLVGAGPALVIAPVGVMVIVLGVSSLRSVSVIESDTADIRTDESH